jgi:hypothetical protein
VELFFDGGNLAVGDDSPLPPFLLPASLFSSAAYS